MKIINKMIGTIVMIAGMAIWSVNYLIAKAMSAIGHWIAGLMNAPEVGMGITILICLLCIALFALVTVAGGIVIWLGSRIYKL